MVGTTVLTSGQGQERRIARLSDISIRPHLTLRNQAHDVAVIKLARPVKGIKPIGLAPVGSDASEDPGRLSTVAGWSSVLAVPLRSIRSRGSSSSCLIHKVRGETVRKGVRTTLRP